MNDIEKLSSDIKKLRVIKAKQAGAERTRADRNKRLAPKVAIAGGVLEELDPAEIVNALPNNNDGQHNTLLRADLVTGVVVRVSAWDSMREEDYSLSFAVDDDPYGYLVRVPSGFTPPIEVILALGDHQFEHGVHTVKWNAFYHGDANTSESIPAPFFIDIVDPNSDQQPDAIQLPADLPNGEDITQEYLDEHGGVVFTMPPFSAHKEGDTYSFYIDGQAVVVDQPAVIPFQFTVDRAVFDALQPGLLTLTYTVSDRAGNRTNVSMDEHVRYHQAPTPVLNPPDIPEAPTITLEDARDGVAVFHNYSEPLPDDFITVHWHGRPQDSYWIPDTFMDVPFEEVKAIGLVYTATVYYEVNRGGGVFKSGEVTVDVDLQSTGPVNPDEPNIVNPDLGLLVLTSFTGQTNAIVTADKSQAATITVPMFDPATVGDMIQVYYASLDNPVGAAVPITQGDIDADEVTVTLPWVMIDAVGNGTIEAFYRIYPTGKPENAQQSPMTEIVVTVNNLEDLPLCEFPDRNVEVDVINCDNEPWDNGVNVRLTYPFLEEDVITLDWVLDSTYPTLGAPVPTTPVEASRKEFRHRVTIDEQDAGVATVNVGWGEHLSLVELGAIVVGWRLERGDVSGTSALHYVRYSRQKPGPGNPTCP
ncbi:hypothetical protein ACIP1T_05440 [Pseudomonas japonica]|uniref:hypothetical protein n=1 Tax=Pseudomonas japonica TaxID=256466 RepID=UPI003819C288